MLIECHAKSKLQKNILIFISTMHTVYKNIVRKTRIKVLYMNSSSTHILALNRTGTTRDIACNNSLAAIYVIFPANSIYSCRMLFPNYMFVGLPLSYFLLL